MGELTLTPEQRGRARHLAALNAGLTPEQVWERASARQRAHEAFRGAGITVSTNPEPMLEAMRTLGAEAARRTEERVLEAITGKLPDAADEIMFRARYDGIHGLPRNVIRGAS